jgi:rubrerythrin
MPTTDPARTPAPAAPARGGALDDLSRDPSSCKRVLSVVGAGGAAAPAAAVAACGSDDADTTTAAKTNTGASGANRSDLEIVNYALTLEYLEAAFYTDVVKAQIFSGAQQELLTQIRDSERQHVAALTATAKKLGGTPAPRPSTKFPLGSKAAVAKLAAEVENLGAAAYLGQAARIQSKEVLAAALAIHSVEGRHAAALNTLVGRSITPNGAFAKPATQAEVLKQVKPFIVS